MSMTLDPAGIHELLEFCAGLDLKQPGPARAALEDAFPFDGDVVQGIATAMRAGVVAGTLCNRGEPPVQYSRVWKAADESLGFSADAVLMDAPGPLHLHPNGEIDLCFAEEGDPRFDGNPPGWVVYPPGSKHVPTVSGGKMLILYLLPDGAIEFLQA